RLTLEREAERAFLAQHGAVAREPDARAEPLLLLGEPDRLDLPVRPAERLAYLHRGDERLAAERERVQHRGRVPRPRRWVRGDDAGYERARELDRLRERQLHVLRLTLRPVGDGEAASVRRPGRAEARSRRGE